MQQSICVLGRQPAIGRAELESLYNPELLEPIGSVGVLCAMPSSDVAFARLGGSIKLCDVLEIVPSTDWRQLQQAVIAAGVRLAKDIPEGKIQLGLSAYDLRVSTRQLTAGGLELKKALRKAGHSVRLVQNQELTLNSAQVIHNHLTGERGIELVLVRRGNQTILARTVTEQDIEAYTERDRGRPKRDARVGMLPPKLAQIIINLATSSTPPDVDFTLLDPFCGTGVILQEALLMGYSAYGTDLEQRMIDYTQANLDWLNEKTTGSAGGDPGGTPSTRSFSEHDGGNWIDRTREKAGTPLEIGDATAHLWEKSKINAVACETYLGQPYVSLPDRAKLDANIRTCNLILEKFLKNIGGQIASGTRLCLAVPAWQTKPDQFKHLPLLDHLSDLGYNRIDFKYARDSELVYYRSDQIVARELLVITRK